MVAGEASTPACAGFPWCLVGGVKKLFVRVLRLYLKRAALRLRYSGGSSMLYRDFRKLSSSGG